MNIEKRRWSKLLNSSVIIAALGYFVDVYDLVLFSMVRIPSLKDLGITDMSRINSVGLMLHNWQMFGMLTGGVIWGILGDKRGRLSVLFASIFTYSVANIANAFVDVFTMVSPMSQYAFWRFIAGFGLAGELGVGITLVSEVMHKEDRGYGTMVVASVGVTGAVFAAIASLFLHWKTTYILGGVLGLALLVLRISVFESGMFAEVKKQNVSRGNFFSLFYSYSKFSRYIKCILIGVPIWYVIGLLIMYGATRYLPLYLDASTYNATKVQPIIIMIGYMGLVLGDICSGTLSQYLKSRKKALFMFLTMTAAFIALYFVLLPYINLYGFYAVCFLLGFSCGYWAVFVTVAAEQFGTNIRATVATTAPNFVRGAFVLISALDQLISGMLKSVYAASIIVGIICLAVAFLSLYFLRETFGKDMNYTE